MGLEYRGGSGLYYYRKKRVGDRVISEYVGSGMMAVLEDSEEIRRRKESRAETERNREQMQDIRQLSAQIEAFYGEIDAIYRLHMQEMGYHQHKRGEWRRKRQA